MLTLDYIPSSCIIVMHVVKGRRYSVYTVTDEVDGDGLDAETNSTALHRSVMMCITCVLYYIVSISLVLYHTILFMQRYTLRHPRKFAVIMAALVS